MALLSTLVTTAFSWLATTAWLTLTTGSSVEQLDTAGMMRGLALVLVLPVIVGQLLRAAPPLARTANRHRTSLGVVARLLIVVIMLRAAVEVSARVGDEHAPSAGVTLLTAVVCLGTHLLALLFGFTSSRLLRLDRGERIAVAFAGSQKTLPVSLYLFDVYFSGYPLAVLPMVFYHVGQLVVDTFIADLLKRPAGEESGDVAG